VRDVRSHSSASAWLTIAVLVLALAGLLLFQKSLSQGMAGCYGALTGVPYDAGAQPGAGDQDAPLPAAGDRSGTETKKQER
jgi:hypothetical protein